MPDQTVRLRLRRFTLSRPAPGYLQAVFDHPPTNCLDNEAVAELAAICDILETDHSLRVLVVSANSPDYFMTRHDVLSATRDLEEHIVATRAFARATARLSGSDVISIALLRGRARGWGSELALACDLRFASIDTCVLGQPEVSSGLLPVGGAIERLTRLVGRARASEIIVTGDDFDALTAEWYGWINRALPDGELDGFVDDMARRIASFDAVALATAKGLLARSGGNLDGELRETIRLLPTVALSSRERRARIHSRAARIGVDFELRLGYHLGLPDQD